MKQKCADAGSKFYQQYKAQNGGDNTSEPVSSIFNNGTVFNQKLNTCLVELSETTTDFSKTPHYISRDEWVFDSYSGQSLAGYHCTNDECTKGDGDYQKQKNALMSDN